MKTAQNPEPEPEKKKNIFFRITRIQKKTKPFFPVYLNPEKNEFFFFGLPQSGKKTKPSQNKTR